MKDGLQISLPENIDNYAVIGNPIAHSLSPQIHKLFAEQTGQKLYYQALLVEPGCFSSALAEFQRLGGKGLNITVPFKIEACAAVNHLTERAEKAGAVNTIWFDQQGQSHGDTTDATGLLSDLSANGIQLKNKNVLILGAGGAVRGIVGPILEQGVSGIIVANRTHSRAVELVKSFATRGNIQACQFNDLNGSSFDLIINGTSASLSDEIPPVSAKLALDSCCYDMVYSNSETAFVKWARQNGARKAIDGLGMLVGQAAESFYIWRGLRPDGRPVIEALRKQI